MPTKALLVVSFGTSVAQTREKTIHAIETDLMAAFPEYRGYRAWTSNRIRKRIERETGEHIDSVEEALDKIVSQRPDELLVQPTHLLFGLENDAMLRDLRERAKDIPTLWVGEPLLSSEEDFSALAKVLPGLFPDVTKEDALLFMGHGSSGADNSCYLKLQSALRADGRDNIHIALVEAAPGISDVLPDLKRQHPRRIFLAPLMVVAGEHVRNDMAGDAPDSWKSRLEAEGYEVICIQKGLGEYPEVRRMYEQHARQARR